MTAECRRFRISHIVRPELWDCFSVCHLLSKKSFRSENSSKNERHALAQTKIFILSSVVSVANGEWCRFCANFQVTTSPGVKDAEPGRDDDDDECSFRHRFLSGPSERNPFNDNAIKLIFACSEWNGFLIKIVPSGAHRIQLRNSFFADGSINPMLRNEITAIKSFLFSLSLNSVTANSAPIFCPSTARLML